MEQVFDLAQFLSRLAEAGPVNSVCEINIQEILRDMVEGGVEFLLTGAVAVGCHGYVRGTGELDVVPAPEPENLRRLGQALERLSAQVEGDLEEDSRIFATRLGRVHVMQRVGSRLLWEELSPEAIKVSVRDLPIKVVSYDDLVRLKELAGRPEDLADLQRLREARES
jgi:hypothetical protein